MASPFVALDNILRLLTLPWPIRYASPIKREVAGEFFSANFHWRWKKMKKERRKTAIMPTIQSYQWFGVHSSYLCFWHALSAQINCQGCMVDLDQHKWLHPFGWLFERAVFVCSVANCERKSQTRVFIYFLCSTQRLLWAKFPCSGHRDGHQSPAHVSACVWILVDKSSYSRTNAPNGSWLLMKSTFSVTE